MPSTSLGKMRKELLEAARTGNTVTYGQLMKNHRLSRGRPLSNAIGEIDRVEYAHGAPGFAAIVVRKDTCFPGGGYFCDDDLPAWLSRSKERSADPRLSPSEKNHILEQQRKIWAYYARPPRR